MRRRSRPVVAAAITFLFSMSIVFPDVVSRAAMAAADQPYPNPPTVSGPFPVTSSTFDGSLLGTNFDMSLAGT
jgi:hypothetical protein